MDKLMAPQPVSDLDIAFPADVSKLMPEYAEIPEEFKSWRNPWNTLASECFFSGLEAGRIIPKEGIDEAAAFRHIQCVMGSFEPGHEHKIAAIAYLFSQWFDFA